MKTTKQNVSFEQHLQQQIHKLPNERMPERDLWRGVELGLEASESGSKPVGTVRSSWFAIAASIAFLVSVSWLGVNQLATEKGLDGNALVQSLSSQHEAQKQALLVQYDGQAALTENWQQQLSELDAAAEAIKSALAQDPNNTALLRMLQNVYQQQITLIERVHAPKWQQI
ncbi:hypothetical protein DXV75_10005 [Alteromonas aestuariivivens]|uniref:Uncharacterized protein n=1 Tax=Alteromonas aestuariivivens TaxID=1938339 RepID=A0A3D8M778_9ALTE|nr:hypothetical protein [Alteromonas aestuariivivens]RDV25612.1 hypothetical protein DXV75_10005 [Alteromonas aestuariivivens]